MGGEVAVGVGGKGDRRGHRRAEREEPAQARALATDQVPAVTGTIEPNEAIFPDRQRAHRRTPVIVIGILTPAIIHHGKYWAAVIRVALDVARQYATRTDADCLFHGRTNLGARFPDEVRGMAWTTFLGGFSSPRY